MSKYSDDLTDWLLDCGYTTCFFVAGGNIMHLIESFSKKLEMIPVVHEVAAVIAADYFNEVSSNDGYVGSGKALALVTVGPGVTNTVTAIAGSFIDGRELILIGGQVKSSDVKENNQRQRGVQEIDGVEILSSITKASVRLEKRMTQGYFKRLVGLSGVGRKGPVYLEICLDVQGSQSEESDFSMDSNDGELHVQESRPIPRGFLANELNDVFRSSSRPLILIGGGISRVEKKLIEDIRSLGIPIATTWHGADRISSEDPLYAGRPNLFGQRWANVVFQQADLIISLGSSLGLQQTGFNLREFAPLATVLQVDIDPSSMKSQYNQRIVAVPMSAQEFVTTLLDSSAFGVLASKQSVSQWRDFVLSVRSKLPLVEEITFVDEGYVNPFAFIDFLSKVAPKDLNFIPCSSGGSYTTAMQVFEQKTGHLIVSSRGLGSMGIGLSGAIGAAQANGNITWVVEGDGGMAQNLQEIGTIAKLGHPIKVIVFNNNGYASIRSTQKKYFGGNYVGCDSQTGLGLPNFRTLSLAYGLKYTSVESPASFSDVVNILLDQDSHFIEVFISADQVFLPKIDSKILADGTMTSNPLHQMSPSLDPAIEREVLPWITRRADE